jgi:predicted ATPase/DNA-binding XRE family transcriptional regulator
LVSFVEYNRGDKKGYRQFMSETFSFGEWMARRRRTLDLTQRELAAQTNCALATIKKIELDERRPSRDLAEALAVALQIPTEAQPSFVECARGLRPVDALTAMRTAAQDDRRNHAAATAADLPVSATPLIGRASELAHMMRLLDQPICRLLTLIGPGGAGKTRLAIEAARRLHDRFADGVVFVPLAAVTDLSLMPATIAHSLHLALSGSAEAQLFAYLRDKTMLLVLDNCEQIVDGISWLADLLANAPGVKLLATSRERLQLAEEWIYTVPMLDEAQAIDLFDQIAQRLNPHFQTSEQRAAVSTVCRLVEYLPLAIELAASWTPFMSCEQIAQNVQRDIDFLSANVRNVPERHRSIRAVFDHSWRLLSPAEQDVMMRLSVFRGGWAVDDAEPIAGATLLMLRELIEKSLVRVAGYGRYDLHELTRQYTADQLDAMGQAAQARRQHSEVYLALAAQLDSQLYGPDGIAAFTRLDQEHDNLRAGISWALAAGEMDIARHYVDSLWNFWLRRGHWSEAEHWSRAAIGQAGEADSTLLCWTLVCAAVFNALQGRYMEAEPYRERFVAMAHRLEDPEMMMRVLLILGQAVPDMEQAAAAFERLFIVGEQVEVLSKGRGAKEALLAEAHFLYGDQLRFAGRAAEAETHYRQSLELFHQLGNVDMIAYPIGNLGRLALEEGRIQEAYDRLMESVAISRAVGSRVGIADWLQQFGKAALALDDVAQAEMCFEEALALYQEMGNQRGCPAVLADLGSAALLKGDIAQARRYLHESLSAYRQIYVPLLKTFPDARWKGEMQRELLVCLQATALVEVTEGAIERALTLFGAAATLRAQVYNQADLGLQARVDEALKTVQSQLSAEAYAKAWETGQSMSLEIVLAYALGG